MIPAERNDIPERVQRARAASARCRRRLEQIHDRTDPRDAPLRGFLADLVSEEARSESRLMDLDKGASPAPLEATDVAGDAPIDRDAALFLAEETEQERSRAFRHFADDLADGEIRVVLRLEAARGRPRLILLRSVWLLDGDHAPRLDSLSRASRTWLIDELAGLIVQVRDGRVPQHDLRSLFDRGLAAGEAREETISVLLDSLKRTDNADPATVSGGLDDLARADSPAEILHVARRIITSLMEHRS